MTHLKEGDKAPGFSAPNQDGKTINLNDFSGKKVILYFYPKDDTPGCTSEAINLKENYSELKEKGFEVIGVSADDVESHNRFSCKYELPFNLIADIDKKIVNDYGVYGERSLYGRKFMGIARTTFIIDEKGKIERIIKKVKAKEHAEQILEKL